MTESNASASLPPSSPADRRPLTSRDTRWAKASAFKLAAWGVSPNTISVFSIVFGGVACVAFILTHPFGNPWIRTGLFLIAAAAMQMRLVCNLLDGMVAVEAGAGATRVGEIFNDLPDRVADVLIFIGAGIGAGGLWGPVLGLGAAVGSLFTAYIRVFGKSMGARSHFIGPMAKQHRMAVMTASCFIAIGFVHFSHYLHVWLKVPLAIVCLGCAVTVVRRLKLIVRDLEAA